MRIGLPAVCLAAFVLSVSACFAADWPHWRGPTANGIAPDTEINKDWKAKPPALLWRVDLSDKGYAGPCVAEGRVYIVDHEGEQDVVRCLSLADGQEIWRYAYPDAAGESYGFARATPAVSEKKVYTLSRLGTVNCLNALTGERLWSRHLVTDLGGRKPGYDYCASPIVDDQQLILMIGGDHLLAALDKTTGETLWRGGGADSAGYATPVAATLLDVKQYVVHSEQGVQGVAAENGQVLWRYPWRSEHGIAGTPLVWDDQVFCSTSSATVSVLLRITPQGPVVKWQTNDLWSRIPSPVLYHDYLWGGGEGRFSALDPNTGATLFKEGGFDQSSVLAVDGVLLVLMGGTGELRMMAPTNPPQVLGAITPLGGQSWTAPIIADGKLLIRNKQALVCLNLAQAK